MGKLVVTEFMTLDGVAQAPGGPEEDREGGFAHGGWQIARIDPGSGAGEAVFERASRMDALLLGRKTYEIFAGYWPTAPGEIPFTGLLNRTPRYVASHSLSEPLGWRGSTLLTGDLAESVTALMQRHDQVNVIGSLDLLQSLLRLGLVDQLELWVYPLVLGSGKRVFDGGTQPTSLRLSESVTYPNGVLQLVYEPAGEVASGGPAIASGDARRAGRE